jgi:hypothetical protein
MASSRKQRLYVYSRGIILCAKENPELEFPISRRQAEVSKLLSVIESDSSDAQENIFGWDEKKLTDEPFLEITIPLELNLEELKSIYPYFQYFDMQKHLSEMNISAYQNVTEKTDLEIGKAFVLQTVLDKKIKLDKNQIDKLIQFLSITNYLNIPSLDIICCWKLVRLWGISDLQIPDIFGTEIQTLLPGDNQLTGNYLKNDEIKRTASIISVPKYTNIGLSKDIVNQLEKIFPHPYIISAEEGKFIAVKEAFESVKNPEMFGYERSGVAHAKEYFRSYYTSMKRVVSDVNSTVEKRELFEKRSSENIVVIGTYEELDAFYGLIRDDPSHEFSRIEEFIFPLIPKQYAFDTISSDTHERVRLPPISFRNRVILSCLLENKLFPVDYIPKCTQLSATKTPFRGIVEHQFKQLASYIGAGFNFDIINHYVLISNAESSSYKDTDNRGFYSNGTIVKNPKFRSDRWLTNWIIADINYPYQVWKLRFGYYREDELLHPDVRADVDPTYLNNFVKIDATHFYVEETIQTVHFWNLKDLNSESDYFDSYSEYSPYIESIAEKKGIFGASKMKPYYSSADLKKKMIMLYSPIDNSLMKRIEMKDKEMGDVYDIYYIGNYIVFEYGRNNKFTGFMVQAEGTNNTPIVKELAPSTVSLKKESSHKEYLFFVEGKNDRELYMFNYTESIQVEEKNLVEEKKSSLEEKKNSLQEKNSVEEKKSSVEEEKNLVEEKKSSFEEKKITITELKLYVIRDGILVSKIAIPAPKLGTCLYKDEHILINHHIIYDCLTGAITVRKPSPHINDKIYIDISYDIYLYVSSSPEEGKIIYPSPSIIDSHSTLETLANNVNCADHKCESKMIYIKFLESDNRDQEFQLGFLSYDGYFKTIRFNSNLFLSLQDDKYIIHGYIINEDKVYYVKGGLPMLLVPVEEKLIEFEINGPTIWY